MITRLVSLLCVFTLGGLLVGCSGDGASDSAAEPAAGVERAGDSGAGSGSSGGSGDSGNEAAADSAAKANPADKSNLAAKQAAASSSTAVTRLVRTAQITLEVRRVETAAESVRYTAVALGGIVGEEKTGLPRRTEEDQSGSSAAAEESVITLRVPEPKMDDALTRISGIGREQDRSTSTEDVTATIADLDSRVATQTRSVTRVRDLLARAKTLQDIVLLESELARREADLESVQARQRALADKAALATITVVLRTEGTVVDDPDEAGFVTGLDGGWTALKTSTTVVLTVVGAVLPIGVVLALIAIPAFLIRRRYKGATAAGPANATTPPGPLPAP